MRPGRMTTVLMMIALGALGAWFGVRAQERRQPMPTVAREAYANYEQEASAAEEARSRAIDHPPPIQINETEPTETPKLPVKNHVPLSAADPTIVVPEMTEGLLQASSLPVKLPAELPEQPHKSEAKPPVTPPSAAPPEPMPPAAKTPEEVPEVPIVSPVPELLAPPKKRAAEKPAANPPAAPESKDIVPPGPLPQFVEPSPMIAPPPVAAPSIPKTGAARDDKQTPPPAAGIHAKPLAPAVEPAPNIVAPPVPKADAVLPTPTVEPKPTIVAPPAAKSDALPPAPTVEFKPNVTAPPIRGPEILVPPVPQFPGAIAPPEVRPAPAPMVTPPAKTSEAPATPARPPAFLLVKPRRAEAPPMPAPPAPTLIDQPRAPEAPLASSAAQVTVEKRGPAVLRQGVSASYQIIVRNRGAAASGPVTVFDEIPRLAKLVTGEPAPSQLGDKAIWTLPPLPANSETLLRLDLQATGTGEFVGHTTVFVSAATATTRAKIQRDPTAKTVSAGPLAIQLHAPPGGVLGQPVVFEIHITNHSKQQLTDLVLHARLSEGFTHPSGNEIEADIGHLDPGATKAHRLTVAATRVGRQTAEVKITAAGGTEAEAQASVPITGSALSIKLAPTTRLVLDRDGDVRIDVTNHQAEALRNVVIADTLPEALQFVAASDRGIYQAGTRTVQWLIDNLPPGETRSVSLRLQGKTPGQFPKEVSARAETLPDTRAQSVVQVEGYSDLVLKITPRDQPLEVGKETVCEVRVQNFGNVAAGNVQIQVELPAGVMAGYIQGPTAHRKQGRTLVFDPIVRLAARSQAVYHVGAIAQADGDLRIRGQVVSDQIRTPVTREAALVVYRDR